MAAGNQEEDALRQEALMPPTSDEEARLPEHRVTSAALSGPGLTERRVAAFAHGGILLNLITGIGGVIVALALWLYHEKRTEYGSWHALQALVFQAVFLVLLVVFGGIALLLWVLAIPLLRIVVGFCLIPFALGFTLFFAFVLIGGLVYGCTGAVAALEGRDFRYRWVADLIPPLSKP